MVWAAGTSLADGKYTIEDELSRRGGFGITYRAQHTILGTTVVIKAPHAHRQNERNYSNFLACFVKEGKYLEQVAEKQHPNIVKVRDFFYEGDVPCMVMNYVEGETLEDLVLRSGAIPEDTIVPWILTIAEALVQVHGLGLVHRDANPANIIINRDNQPILIDFGIALNIQPRATTTMAALGGHPIFAPYEQLESEDDHPDCEVYRNPKLDISCLAATLYFAITGEYPKRSQARKNSFNQKGEDSLISPQTIKPEISDRIQHAISKGMEMDPDDRPDSMKDWITLLTTNDGLSSKITEPTLESLPLQRLEFQTIELSDRGEVIAQPDKTAQYFDEILDEESGLSLRMIVIPSGSFVMGSPPDELNSYNDEKPQHLVTVPSFAIGQLTVTQAQWAAIASLKKVKRRLNPTPSYYSGEDRPVERVNWEEAIEFCDRLKLLTSKPYRLPTEAEWEYACRARTATPFYCGQTITTDFANYRGVDEDRGESGKLDGNYGKGPKGKFRGQTIDAHEFSPNPFGLHNMHGNVWEWCMDQWHSSYEDAPINGSAWIDQDADVNCDRVLRGGSWYYSPQNCRSAIRAFLAPDARLNLIGFRVLCRLRPQDS